MKARQVLCVVPDSKKSQGRQRLPGVGGQSAHPGIDLQRHEQTTIYLDKESAALLQQNSPKST